MPITEDPDTTVPLLKIGDEIDTDDGPGVLMDVQINAAEYNGEWQLEPPTLVVELDDGQTIHTCLCSVTLPDSEEGTELLHQEYERLWPPMMDEVPEDAEQLIPEGNEEMRTGDVSCRLDRAILQYRSTRYRLAGYEQYIVPRNLDEANIIVDIINEAYPDVASVTNKSLVVLTQAPDFVPMLNRAGVTLERREHRIYGFFTYYVVGFDVKENVKRLPGSALSLSQEDFDEITKLADTLYDLERKITKTRKQLHKLCLDTVVRNGFATSVDQLEYIILQVGHKLIEIKRAAKWSSGREVRDKILRELATVGIDISTVPAIVKAAYKVKSLFHQLSVKMAYGHEPGYENRYLEIKHAATCSHDRVAVDLLISTTDAIDQLLDLLDINL